MSALVEQASKHWQYVAPVLTRPSTEEDYDALVNVLEELLATVQDNENHPLASLASHVGDLIEAFDEAHRPLPKASGVEVLRYLMQEHGLTQSDLPEVGGQSVVSDILGGKRRLNVRHIRALSERFGVPADVFF